MDIKNEITKFVDKNGTEIKAGDILYREFYARWRERPGHKRVAIRGLSDEEVIVPDEGDLLKPKKHWVTYKVGWMGACLIADRHECSDFQALTQAELFNEKGDSISEGCGFHYFNAAFDSTVYEVMGNDS